MLQSLCFPGMGVGRGRTHRLSLRAHCHCPCAGAVGFLWGPVSLPAPGNAKGNYNRKERPQAARLEARHQGCCPADVGGDGFPGRMQGFPRKVPETYWGTSGHTKSYHPDL